MTRKDRRREKGSWHRQNIGTNGYLRGERFARIRVNCPRCGETVGLFGRAMDPELDHGPVDGIDYFADSLADGRLVRTSNLEVISMRCTRCRLEDVQVRQDRLAAAINELHARCLDDDTPRTKSLTG